MRCGAFHRVEGTLCLVRHGQAALSGSKTKAPGFAGGYLPGNPSGVEFMDYVRAGQVIRLGPHQTIVLSYMASCVRETITGGTVTVGTQRSEVQSGHVRR